jgi:glutaredoxin
VIRLRLLSRPGCHLCEAMKSQVDELLARDEHEWEIVDVDADDETARRWSDAIPVLFVNGELFATGSLPAIDARARLLRAGAAGAGSP